MNQNETATAPAETTSTPTFEMMDGSQSSSSYRVLGRNARMDFGIKNYGVSVTPIFVNPHNAPLTFLGLEISARYRVRVAFKADDVGFEGLDGMPSHSLNEVRESAFIKARGIVESVEGGEKAITEVVNTFTDRLFELMKQNDIEPAVSPDILRETIRADFFEGRDESTVQEISDAATKETNDPNNENTLENLVASFRKTAKGVEFSRLNGDETDEEDDLPETAY